MLIVALELTCRYVMIDRTRAIIAVRAVRRVDQKFMRADKVTGPRTSDRIDDVEVRSFPAVVRPDLSEPTPPAAS
jgi:hypothetical protein